MKKEIAVSVIVPIHNSEKYLRECLDSIVSQSLKSIEVICVDDGSTDGSAAILNEYKRLDPRVRVITQTQCGVSSARNHGIAAAVGEYLAFVDSDDLIDRNAYKNAYAKAKKTNADIVVFGGQSFPGIDWRDRGLATRNVTYRKKSIYALFYENGSSPYSVNKLYRSALFHNGCIFDETLLIGEDQALMFDLFPEVNTIVYIRGHYYHYRQHQGSTMCTMNMNMDDMLLKHVKVFQHIIASWERNALIEENGRDLAVWMIGFFNIQDKGIKNASPELRIDVCKEIVPIIESLTDTTKIPPYARKAFLYMKKSADGTAIADDLSGANGSVVKSNHAPGRFIRDKVSTLAECVRMHGLFFTVKVGYKKIRKEMKHLEKIC